MTALAPTDGTVPALKILKAGQEALSARAGSATLKLTAELFAGDHWAKGEGWVGPLPRSSDGQLTALIDTEVKRIFVSRNLLRDVVERHRNGIAGREPLWTITPRRGLKKGEKPNADEQQRIDNFSAALTEWWDENSVWPAVQTALDTALWSGTGYLRLFISAHDLDALPGVEGQNQRGILAGKSLPDIMRKISIHAPAWAQTTITRDLDGRSTGAVHAWTGEDKQTHYEVQERQGDKITLHPDLRSGGQDNPERPAIEYPTDLLVYELRLTPLVTESIRRLNLWLNKTLTMGSRNIDLGGFTETTIINAQVPEGKFVDDPQNPGKKVWKAPAKYIKGGGTINYVNGFAQMRLNADTGKMEPVGVTTPSVIHKDPTPFQVFKDTFMAAREMIYDEAKQLHVLITADGSVNGVSRQQAVNDFLSSLEATRIQLEAMLRWLLGTVLKLALHLQGKADGRSAASADDLRVRVQARVSAIQPTPQDIEAALKLEAAGKISEETAMQRCGVEDVQAERDTRAAEGITPALALVIASAAPAPFIAMRALMLAFPALGLTEQDVEAQKAIDLMNTAQESGAVGNSNSPQNTPNPPDTGTLPAA